MTHQELTSPNEYELLEALSSSPVTTQADLAARVGVAVGTVNWYLKRWSKKGYIKIRRIGRWQWSYLLTPEGIARKARLAGEYIEASLSLYRRMRTEARQLLADVKTAGYNQVILDGEGEVADICRLTCLELEISVVAAEHQRLPRLCVDGLRLTVQFPPGDDTLAPKKGKRTPTESQREAAAHKQG